MKYLILINIVLGLWSQFNRITITNDIKLQAEKAYLKKDYKKAATLYQNLITSHGEENENIRLNLANALFLGNEQKKATAQYQFLTNSPDFKTRSISYQQLGIIAANKGKYEIGLENFKQALKMDPDNEKARYNYELIKKIREQELSLQQSHKKNPQGKEKEKNTSENGTQKEKEALIKQLNNSGRDVSQWGDKQKGGNLFEENNQGDHERKSNQIDPNSNDEEKELEADKKGNKEEEALKTRRLQEIKMSKDKAEMILKLLESEEIQYIQQRRKNESNKEYKNKPDW